MPQRLFADVMGVTTLISIADADDPQTAAEVLTQWHDLAIDDACGGGTTTVLTVAVGPHDDGRPYDVNVPFEPVENVGERLASQITLTALDRVKGTALLLHAGAVALDDGRVIAFVGPSGRGKTTSVTVLGKRWRYVTDETLVVGSDGAVVPYPKPLLIGKRPATKVAHAATALGLTPVQVRDDDLRLGALVLLDRRDGFDEPVVTTVDLVEAIVGLATETSYLSRMHRPLQTLARLIAQTGGVRRVTYTEATTLPGVLPAIVSATGIREATDVPEVGAPGVGPVDAAAPSEADAPDGRPEAETEPAPTIARTPFTDALQVGDRLLVLRDHVVVVLDGIGPAVWRAASDATVEHIAAAVLRELPAPTEVTDPVATVASAIDELREAGVVV